MLAAASLCAQAARAQSTDPQPAEASEAIVVTGQGLAPPAGSDAYDIVVFDRDRLTDSASGRIEDVLGQVAGLASYRRSDSRSANPTSQGITLRGLGGNASSRALVLLDGVPQNDPFGGWVPFPAFLPDRLAEIRVTRGGGSGFDGPGALAGTVAMDSAGPDLLPSLAADIAYGSRDSVDASAVGAVSAGDGFLSYAASYARGDGFTPIVAEDRGAVDRPAPYEQSSLALRSVVELGNGSELQSGLSGFVDRRDGGTPFTGIRSEGADASMRLVHHGDWDWSALAYLQTRAFGSRFASVDDGRDTASPALDQYSVPSTGIGGRVEIEPPMPGGVTLRLGSDFRRLDGRTHELYIFSDGQPTRRRVAGGRSLTTGAFADGSIEQGALTLDFGARIDGWWLSNGRLVEQPLAGGAPVTDAAFEPRHGWEATGRVGAAFAIDRAVRLRAAAYRGWRLPTLNELYRPYRVGADATAANAALSPEHLTGVEAGIDLAPGEGWSLRTTAFWNRLDDAVANVTLANGPGTFPGVGFVSAAGVYRQRRNIDAVESVGVEADLDWRSGPWRVDIGYAFTDARVRASGDAAPLDGLRPAQTAAHHASATAAWHPANGPHIALTARYVAPQFEDDLNGIRLDDAVTFDASASMPIGERFDVTLRGENLADARVESAIDSDGITERATPRTLWLGIAVHLD